MGDSELVHSQEFCVIANHLKILYKMITSDANDIGLALIFIACIIAIFGAIGIIYHCYMWTRYANIYKCAHNHHRNTVPSNNSNKKQETKCHPSSKIYEPIYVKPFVKSQKEYETQVLQMSVAIVEDSSDDNSKDKMPINDLISVSYSTRSEQRINDFNILHSNVCTPGIVIENSINAENIAKNPLYCELSEEHSSQSLSSSNEMVKSNSLFSDTHIYSTCHNVREKLTEL